MDSTTLNIKAMTRLLSMGDWLKLGRFNEKQILVELEEFSSQWKKYNPRTLNNRFGLSVTSFDGQLSGVPDLDSLHQYNIENNTNLKNYDCTLKTAVYEKSSELQNILAPYLPWLTRCHFIKLNKGGFFPEHYDIDKLEYNHDEIRLIAMIKNCSSSTFKFCYEDQVKTSLQDGQIYYFNANKRHTVFSTTNNSIQLVIVLKFDHKLFSRIIENYEVS